ncbi:DUF998 domain-containing protein [Microbacterium sp. LMI1-1-1.1]|uniref:DUF998 domain-containing protein n=1 Tax=Microbacterium sp. LMI1-1-1.1 TaxID=3135223 RepID=UPI00346698B4
MTETLDRRSSVSPSDRPRAARPGRAVRLARIGALAAFVSAILIWVSRLLEPSVHYVSQLGAPSMATAPIFNPALLLLAAAAVLVDRALAVGRGRYVVGWPIALTLLVCGLSFGLASVVTCSPGCPVPFTEGALWQDTVHIAAAVLGFVLAIVAMAQVAALRGRPWMRWGSIVTLVLVGVTSFTGAMLALFGGDTVLGGNLEFTAATLAIAWFGVFGLQVAADEASLPA